MVEPPDEPHPLRPVLEDAEAELRRRLREACDAEAGGISDASAEEIRRLEDTLLAAAVAAGQTLALRRHMRPSSDLPQARKHDSDAPQRKAAEESSTTLREFRDTSGRPWRAWAVTPGLARPARNAERFLGDFHQGWICFESLDSSARRRLPCARSRLEAASDEELEELLQQAISAPERKTSGGR